jgi:membrane protein YdbS with pleckstrin-like domain
MESTGIDPTRRLLFWLKVPYVLDAVLVVVGVAYLIAGNGVGWWVLVFAFLRAVIGTISLFWIAPRMIARRSDKDL